jgi:hypothetical protein
VLLPLLLTACASAPLVTALPAPAPAPLASPTATLASTGPAPGHWQLLIEVEDLPGAGKIPPQTMTLCSTPEDKKQWQEMVSGKAAAGCAVKDYQVNGASISYAMLCAGGIEGAARITVVDDDHYSGDSSLSLRTSDKPAVIRSKVTATRLSPACGL